MICAAGRETRAESVDAPRDPGNTLRVFHLQVCLLGKRRTYPPAGEVAADERRTRYIRSRQGRPGSPPGREPALPAAPAAAAREEHPDGRRAPDGGAAGAWLAGFQPREKAERVRNCAALPREFVDQVVSQVARLLLRGEPRAGSPPSRSARAWNRGGEPRPPRACWPSGGGSALLWDQLRIVPLILMTDVLKRH